MVGSNFNEKGKKGTNPKSQASDITLDIMKDNGIPTVDWDTLCNEWVMTSISLRGLAEKYGLSYRYVKSKHHALNWKEKLAEYNSMVEEGLHNIRAKKAKEMADKIADLDDKILEVSSTVVDIIEKQINEVGGETPQFERLDSIISIVKDATKTLKDAHYNIRLSGDKATAVVEQNSKTSIGINENEEERIANELGFIRKTEDKPVLEEISSEIVDDDKSPQEPQESESDVK